MKILEIINKSFKDVPERLIEEFTVPSRRKLESHCELENPFSNQITVRALNGIDETYLSHLGSSSNSYGSTLLGFMYSTSRGKSVEKTFRLKTSENE